MRPSISKVNSCFSKVYRFNMALKERTWHQGQTKQLDLLKGRFPNLGSTDRVANKRFSQRQITFGEKTPRSSSLKPPRPHRLCLHLPLKIQWNLENTFQICVPGVPGTRPFPRPHSPMVASSCFWRSQSKEVCRVDMGRPRSRTRPR